MTKILDFKEARKARELFKEESMPHSISELICLSCYDRWIGVYPAQSLMRKMVCACGSVGKIIGTGQSLEAMDDTKSN